MMSNQKTIRRDTLKRLIDAGRIVKIGSYHFDDMLGESRSTNEIPVAMTVSGPDTWKDRKEGVCYLFPSDLTSGSGSATTWTNAQGEQCITLYVHSNSNYDFKVLPKAGR